MRQWDPNFVFLSKTKLKKKAMERAKRKVGFVYGLVVPKSNKSGGLAMLWKENINLEIMGYAGDLIDTIVTEADSRLKWKITGFYGRPEAHKRKESWDQLKALNRKFKLPWICFGDFNEILSMNEKMGGVQRSQRQMDEFRDAVNSCGFKDLGYNGSDYMWCNMQERENTMYIRLDQALATSEWMEQFKETHVYHIVDSTSDHCALLVSDSYHPQPLRKRRFHFEVMWTKRGDCRKIIEEMWSKNMSLNSPSDMALSLKQCAMELSRWNLYAFGKVPKKIQEKGRSLSNLVQ